jgi:hypothetical protein
VFVLFFYYTEIEEKYSRKTAQTQLEEKDSRKTAQTQS